MSFREGMAKSIQPVSYTHLVEALGGLPAHKLHCSVLAEESIKSAIKNYYDRNGIEMCIRDSFST